MIPAGKNDKLHTTILEQTYNVFVDNSNLHSDVVVGPLNMSDNPFTNLSVGSATKERYNPEVMFSGCYDTCVQREIDVTTIITGVQIEEDVQIRKAMNAAIDLTKPEDCGYLWAKFSRRGNNPNPYNVGMFGFRCDPINSSIASIEVGLAANNSQVGQNNENAEYVNAKRKLVEPRYYDEYDGLLQPETFNINSFKTMSTPFEKYNAASIAPDGTILCSSKNSFGVNTTGAFTMDELNSMENNMLSINKRGRIFKNATYTFSKAKASMNYTYNVATGKFAITVSSQVLYTMKIGNYYYPTNVDNWYLVPSYVCPYLLFWYYDKDPLIAGTPAEETNNSLTITITIPNVKGPILHPLFNDFSRKCFTNTTTCNIDINLQADLYKSMFASYISKSDSLPYDATAGTGERHLMPYGGITNIGTGITTISNQKIYLRMYAMGVLTNSIKESLTLPYMLESRIGQRAINFNLPTPTLNTLTHQLYYDISEEKVTIPSFDIGASCPRFLAIYIDGPIPTIISKLEIGFGGSPSIIQIGADSLKSLSRKNGLNISDKDDIQGYDAPFTQSTIGINYEDKRTISQYPGMGTMYLLEYGSDIPLPNGLLPGSTGKSVVISIGITVQRTYKDIGMFGFTYSAIDPTHSDNGKQIYSNINAFHLTESDYIITKGQADKRTDLLDSVAVQNVYNELIEQIKGNTLYIHKNKIYGGNFVSRLFAKAKNIIPKVMKHITNATEKGVHLTNLVAHHAPHYIGEAQRYATKANDIAQKANKFSQFLNA